MLQLSPPDSGPIESAMNHLGVTCYFFILVLKWGVNHFPPLTCQLFVPKNPSPGVRRALLFKDGTTQPAAAVSAPIVIESALVECASEGVCAPKKIIQSGHLGRSVAATFTYLTGGSYSQ